jgi:hypothetical protein
MSSWKVHAPVQAAQGEPRVWLTVTTLVAIQLGWGLWLTPYGFARMGWGGATLAVVVLAGAGARWISWYCSLRKAI